MATGAYVYRDAYYGQRLILNLSRSGNTVSWTLQLQSTGSMYATVSWSGWSNGSKSVSYSSGFTDTLASGSVTQAGAITATVTATMFWGGKPTVTASIGAAGSKPGPPSNFKIERTGTTTLVMSFSKGSDATSTQITASKNLAAWYDLANPTGTTQNVSLDVDTYWRWQAYSKNAIGNSAVIGPFVTYTKPKTPTKPTLAAGKVVNWTLPAAYKHGVQIRRTDNAGTTIAKTYDLEAVTTWTDPVAQKPTTQYSVREWVGPSLDEAKTWSDWSPWSDSAYSISYKAPTSTKFTAQRCEANGTLTELGTYIKITSSGYATSVKDGTTETNKLTRQVRYREIKDVPGAWQTVTTYDNGAPIVWENDTKVIGGGVIADNKAWEVELLLTDSYAPTVTYKVVVPVSKASFSIGRGGTGHGKVWEKGALDVGDDAYFAGKIVRENPAPIYYSSFVSISNVSSTGIWFEAGSLTFTLEHPSRVLLSAKGSLRVDGNALALLGIFVDGKQVSRSDMHSQGKADRSFLSTFTIAGLSAGNHTIKANVQYGVGSDLTNNILGAGNLEAWVL